MMPRLRVLLCSSLVTFAALGCLPPPPSGPPDAAFVRLARCESGGNPRAVSASGRYHGAFQFSRRTWDSVARSVAPEWVGVAPSAAPYDVQLVMARVLYHRSGRGQWPVCGRFLR